MATNKRRVIPRTIYCTEGHKISKRRYSAALRFRQTPTCQVCGSGVKSEQRNRKYARKLDPACASEARLSVKGRT